MFSGCLTYNVLSMSQFQVLHLSKSNSPTSNLSIRNDSEPQCATSRANSSRLETPEWLRRAVNRQPGYRAGTRRADTLMLKFIFVQYNCRFASKFCISDFQWYFLKDVFSDFHHLKAFCISGISWKFIPIYFDFRIKIMHFQIFWKMST